jgi:adenylate cyclase
MGADKEGSLAALSTLRREHRGRIVKTIGDGLLVEFVSVVDAVLRGRGWPLDLRSRP